MQKVFARVEEEEYCRDLEDQFFSDNTALLLSPRVSESLSKRIMDVSISLSLLVFVLSWLYPIVWLLIKSSSKGPVIFKQLRHGKDNIPFYCYKFRTLKMNREADFRQTSINDPRITPIGRILRRTSIDELPQIFNVLKGEMSIVGPRPHPLLLNDVYAREHRDLMKRHVVKPGITGLAQAKGYRGAIRESRQMASRLKLDFFYIKKGTVWMDLIIIFWTAKLILLKNDNAY
ncbi:sugar transferase [Lunatimonas salinarum]|uniref:sugar transferase n=1 Tax=Lunatimonas salinarum TaxID=1774590 RepID=UPI001ADEE5D6|nr:sugar transferase [Lunatimonas salinarum]